MAQVSLVIVNWNGKHLLQRCLPAALNQSFGDYQVLVLDNGSQDGSVDWIEANYPPDSGPLDSGPLDSGPCVRVIRSDRNLGFAAGNNEAIRVTESEFVATLNNDALPAPHWLGQLVCAMRSAPTVGMCASKMVRAPSWARVQADSHLDEAGIIDSCGIEIDRAGIGWNRYSGEPERADQVEPYDILGPCAGAALYRRAMLDQVGLFDEDYFAYYEDIDLAWRAQRAGWRCLYVPSARVLHYHSSTAGEGSTFKGYHLGRNKIWTLIKNYPWPDLAFYLPLILGYDIAAWGCALLGGDLGPLRGRLAAFKALPGVMGKRRAIQSGGERVALCAPLNPLRMWRKQRALRGWTSMQSRMR
jgi:GT2 family glycosyltransferase